ncbi:MAG: DinB family protein [Acidobacteria bacterium]|nr:DinB family protein [Acidobacteriota bacterium]
MPRTYRNGPLGALMDEYERAAAELLSVIGSIDDAEFEAIRDTETQDPNCHSIQTISKHVVVAGYGYAGMLRNIWAVEHRAKRQTKLKRREVAPRMNEMLAYTVDTFEGRWNTPIHKLLSTNIQTGWGQTFDVDQLMEHAVMHVHRHRRQIERFLGR